MKTLCITGASSTGIEQVAQQLYRAGLEPAKGLQRGVSIDMKSWHERVASLISQQQSLGRLWEQMAGELLLTNMADKAWGWHDSNSLWALEFWAELDPSINFLLLCSSPEQFLAKEMLTRGEDIDPQACLSDWQNLHERMLNFYFQYPERCLLVDVEHAAEMPAALCSVVNERWQLLDEHVGRVLADQSESDWTPPKRLASYLAKQWLAQDISQVEELILELQAAQHPMKPEEVTEQAPASEESNYQQVAALLQQYQEAFRQEGEREAENLQLQEARAQVQQLSLQLEELEQQVQNEKQRRTLEVTSLAEEKALLADQLASREHELNKVEQEGEYLRLSLHDAGERLQKREEERDDLVEQRLLIKREAENLLFRLHETQEQLEQSVAQRVFQQQAFARERESFSVNHEEAGRDATRLAQAERELTSFRQETEQLLLSLQGAQKQLEQSEAQREADQRAFAAERESLVGQRQEAQEQLGAKQEDETQLRAAEQERERLQQESEKLLLSLQRTQENLEREVQQHQGQQAKSEALKKRLYHLKQLGGAGMAADNVSISYPQADQVQWDFERVLVGDREYSQLAVAGKLKRGNLILKVTPPDGEPWSLDTDHTASIHTFSALQRELANALPELLQAHLATTFSTPRRVRKWQRAIEKLEQKLAAQPAQLTFQAPELHHVQINPDYEHLWVTLPQASFDGCEPQNWQFRISCANVTPQAFGTQPKLEIPRQQDQLLEGWFQESQDSFGEKLELRFALPDAMDSGVWKRLLPNDQRLLQSLMALLPEILSTLEQQGCNTGRGWQDWHKLAADMRRILQAKAA